VIGKLRSENGRYSNAIKCKVACGYRKGIRLIFLNLDTETNPFRGVERGNANELGDVNESPGKSYLFFLRGGHPGNGSPGDRVVVLEKHHGSCGVRCALAGP
jgi:hypothetical protein